MFPPIPSIDLNTVRFEEPQYLWLLIGPAVLLLLWGWQAARRRHDARQFAHRRTLPVRERFQLFGGLLFWLCLVLASACAIVALARPLARISVVRTAGIDRVAMALFARIATPQLRLTKDPNTFFFFLDHLSDESPFRLEDDTSWDTNMELGIGWGLRLIEKDEELYGR